MTVLAEKIVGAAAEEGAPARGRRASAAKVNAQGRSMGMALTSCTVPAAGKPTFELRRRRDGDRHRHPWRAGPRAHEARDGATRSPRCWPTPIVEDLPFQQGDQVLAFVNGMGGTPLIELYVVFNELARS